MTGYGEDALVRGLTFLTEKQASIANNLANIDTTSFKRRTAIASPTDGEFQNLLNKKLNAVDYTEQADMERGTLRETGNKFDVALDGPQWLKVRNSQGEDFYTRNGELNASLEGLLTTRDGLQVLSTDDTPIELAADGEIPADLTFSPNGTIADPVTGKTFGPLAMLTIDDPHALIPIGKSLYVDPKNQTGTQAVTGLQQGFLEGSNVDSLQELVAMITVERSFSATQKALTGVHQLEENLIANILR